MVACRLRRRLKLQSRCGERLLALMRETGADDDGWAPAPLVRRNSPAGKTFQMTPELYAVVRQIHADLDRRA